MLSNQDMKRYRDQDGNIYWIQQEDEPKENWIEEEHPAEIPLPDPNYVPPYNVRRMAAYPQIEEQLDMLWHAMDKNEIAKAEPFYSTIKNVKITYPKPT